MVFIAPVSNNGFMDKVKDILTLFSTGRDGCPDAFAPAHTGLAAGSLRNPSINYHRANLTFRPIIGRLYIRLGQESEVIGCGLALKPFGQLLGQWMIRRSAYPLQNAALIRSIERRHPGPSKHPADAAYQTSFEPVQQCGAPARQSFCILLGQKPNLADQVGHTILNPNTKQTGIFAIRPQ